MSLQPRPPTQTVYIFFRMYYGKCSCQSKADTKRQTHTHTDAIPINVRGDLWSLAALSSILNVITLAVVG